MILERNRWFKLVLFLAFLLGSQYAISQHTIALDKRGRVKRLNFYVGDYLKVKLQGQDKVGGNIEMINDTSFIINGRHVLLTDVVKAYSARPVFKFLGGAFIVGGTFFIGLDVINNAIQGNHYAFSQSITQPALMSIGVGLVLSYFGTRRTKVAGKKNFKILNTTPIPIRPQKKKA